MNSKTGIARYSSHRSSSSSITVCLRSCSWRRSNLMAIIVLVSALTILTLNTQQTFAMIGTGQSGAVAGGSTGATIGTGSVGQGGGGGGSTGATIGTGSVGQSVDHHLFCNTGMITPICK